jgi:hypothetical protein
VNDFTALYMPMQAPGATDPTKSGFATVEEAEAYVFTKMCSSCKEQRALFLAKAPEPENHDEESPSEFPGCFFEWIVVPTEKMYEPYDSLMEAAGWITAYTRPTNSDVPVVTG